MAWSQVETRGLGNRAGSLECSKINVGRFLSLDNKVGLKI